MEIDYLLDMADNKYQEFNKKIIKTKYEMIGIRMPILKKLATKISKEDYQSFLNQENKYYEVVLLKGFIISKIKNLEEVIKYLDKYIDLIDNWAICDSFCSSFKIVQTNQEYFLNYIMKLITTKEEYKVRVGLVLLLNYYLEEKYLDFIFNILNTYESSYYYVNMAKSWLLAECFIKYPPKTLKFFENNSLDKFTLNKAISKIRDSYRISLTTKNNLLKYKKE